MKKFLSGILAAIMVLTMSCFTSIAVFANDGDSTPTVNPADYFENGQGTEDSPYLIASVDDIDLLREYINDEKGETTGLFFALSANIDFENAEIKPISYLASFRGTFDGCGYTVSNFKISAGIGSEKYAALFGVIVEATIKNINVVNAQIKMSAVQTGYEAALVAKAKASKIISCTVDATSEIIGSTYVGGIVGYLNNSTVEYCTNNAKVTSKYSNAAGTICAGGIVGWTEEKIDGTNPAQYTTSYIKYCVNNGAVAAEWNADGYDAVSKPTIITAGGVLGYANKTAVINCVNTGTVSCDGKDSTQRISAGGVVGRYRTQAGSMLNCYNAATAEGSISAAGAAGSDKLHEGLVLGWINSVTTTTLENCFGIKLTDCEKVSPAEYVNTNDSSKVVDSADTDALNAFNTAVEGIKTEIASKKVVPPTPVEPGDGEGTGDGQTPSGGEDNQTPTGGDNGQAPTGGNDNQAPADGNAEDTTKAADTTAPAADEGCGSAVGAAIVVLVGMAAGTTLVCAKRKEN